MQQNHTGTAVESVLRSNVLSVHQLRLVAFLNHLIRIRRRRKKRDQHASSPELKCNRTPMKNNLIGMTPQMKANLVQKKEIVTCQQSIQSVRVTFIAGRMHQPRTISILCSGLRARISTRPSSCTIAPTLRRQSSPSRQESRIRQMP